MSYLESVESKNQLIAVWSKIVAEQHGEISDDDGVSRMWADSPFGFWNAVTLTNADISADALKDQLGRAAEFMRGRQNAGFLWVFEDLITPEARDELLLAAGAAGLGLAFSGYGMAGDIDIPEPSHPELEMRRVESEDDLVAFGQINGQAYGLPDEVGRGAVAGSRLLRDSYAYIGYRDDRPVACAATVSGPDSIFLALVATLPEETRRGYGEAVTRKAIYEGSRHTGHHRVVLQATEAGRPVYERIGYTVNSPVRFLSLVQS
ncbi:GNAT family N-acetyltransferase [Actinoplanes solisilvae]|uniref:GNAT family N-acetyltransferase n=1 Tax=Actinoplanes solisilvae TaxID=2486853 RepID=UPI000FD75937|nr:GNAT family N-acetyltransferase [Actinoplanes solisilvae]